jgi:hypothetical protein
MAESAQHIELVDLIIDWVRNEYSSNPAMLLFHDKPGAPKDQKPYRINGFVPDVYAVDAPTTTTIIGEAKTPSDLETKHTISQIKGFLNLLVYREKPVFVISTPLNAMPSAKRLLMDVLESLPANNLQVIMLDELSVNLLEKADR